MKRLIAISLLTVFLGANTELHQLLKLPILIHHFLEHHGKDHKEPFTDFLNSHYSNSKGHSETGHHDNLPFKANDCADMHSNVVFHHQHKISLCEPNLEVEKIPDAYNVVIYSSSIRDKIWQPPQFT